MTVGQESPAARHDREQLQHELRRALDGDVRFDAYTRALFSTDASMYAIEPIGVVFPRHADDVAATIAVAASAGVPVLPRGAGTSHCGQTIGDAVVLDCSRHLHRIVAVDVELRRARVQPGVVQDDLNRAVAGEGLWFAPDTSTSNRATLGGMIGNNSCGSRSARYGMTIDHVSALDVVLSDASHARLAPVPRDELAGRAAGSTLEAALYRELPALVAPHRDAIRERLPGFWRRAGGYRLERLVDDGPFDLAKFVVGSEGTLVAITEATVDLVPRPGAVALGVGHFRSTQAAIDATASAMEEGAAAIELVDRFILDLSRSSPEHRHLGAFLDGDPSALLFVEFYGDGAGEAEAGLAALERRWEREGHGYAVVRAVTPAEQAGVRALRKAGLGLLMASGKGPERSLAFVEDTAVHPEHLAEYTQRFAAILDAHGLRAGFYGHASAGCLHVRPFMDLTRPGEPEKMRAVATEIEALVREYGGWNSSEHGDGIARSEFNRGIFGDELYEVLRRVKGVFDPDNRLNPGKKVDAPAMTEHLREPALPLPVPLDTHFDFSEHDGMRGAANRCMRIGACRKGPVSGGVMCPSFMATREEEHSTRGRAIALVKALSEPDPRAALGDERLYEILDLCIECKACKRECPLSVDMATMKSEFLAHYYAQHGTPLRARLFGAIRRINRLGAATAPLSNLPGRAAPLRGLLERVGGIDRRRPLPRFARDTVPRWFARRDGDGRPAATRGEVIFLADSFTSYTEPSVGRAAIELLELAGWRVRLEAGVCCGRASISKGLLGPARGHAEALVTRLAPAAAGGTPIVGCEPSCVLTLREEHESLLRGDPRVAAVGGQARLVEELIGEALADGALTLRRPSFRRVLFHGHCHQKALASTAPTVALLRHLPDVTVTELDAGCCGMAGSFGFEAEHYDVSMAMGGLRLFPAVRAAGPDTVVAATGVSCRQQIDHGTGRRARHPVEIVRDWVEQAPSPPGG